MTPFGLFEFTCTAFGLLNAGARYNQVAHDAEVEAGDGCHNYVDDTLARSKDEEEHLDLLRRIFSLYRSHGLLIHPVKTRLYQTCVDFLGLSISKEGIKPTEEGVEKVQMWPTPTKPKEVAAFVGFVQFYSHFMPTFSCFLLDSKEQKIWKKWALSDYRTE